MYYKSINKQEKIKNNKGGKNMADGWDYANLSHRAKECGGTEKFIKTIEDYNFQQGLEEGNSKLLPIALVSLFGGILLSQLPKFIWYCSSKVKKITNQEVKEAEEKLIEGIKKFEQEEAERLVQNKDQDVLE